MLRLNRETGDRHRRRVANDWEDLGRLFFPRDVFTSMPDNEMNKGTRVIRYETITRGAKSGRDGEWEKAGIDGLRDQKRVGRLASCREWVGSRSLSKGSGRFCCLSAIRKLGSSQQMALCNAPTKSGNRTGKIGLELKCLEIANGKPRVVWRSR